jgi:hypothetical protein
MDAQYTGGITPEKGDRSGFRASVKIAHGDPDGVVEVEVGERPAVAAAGTASRSDDLLALLAAAEVALRKASGKRATGRSKPRTLASVEAVLRAIAEGELVPLPASIEIAGPPDRPSSRRGQWADPERVKRPAGWAKARAASLMLKHLGKTGPTARAVFWALWHRGGGLKHDRQGRAVVDVGLAWSRYLAADAGVADRTARDAACELVEAGLIERIRTRGGWVYRVLIPPAVVAVIEGRAPAEGVAEAPAGTAPDPQTGRILPPADSDHRQRTTTLTGNERPLRAADSDQWNTSDPHTEPFRVLDEEMRETTRRATPEGAAASVDGIGQAAAAATAEAVVADPVAVKRAVLLQAGVFAKQVDELLASPAIERMAPADLAAEIEAARLSAGGGQAGGLVVSRLRRIASRRSPTPAGRGVDRAARTQQTRSSGPERGRGGVAAAQARADADLIAALERAVEEHNAREPDPSEHLPLWESIGGDVLNAYKRVAGGGFAGLVEALDEMIDESSPEIERQFNAAARRAIEIATAAGDEWDLLISSIVEECKRSPSPGLGAPTEIVQAWAKTRQEFWRRIGWWLRDRWPRPTELDEPIATAEERAAIREEFARRQQAELDETIARGVKPFVAWVGTTKDDRYFNMVKCSPLARVGDLVEQVVEAVRRGFGTRDEIAATIDQIRSGGGKPSRKPLSGDQQEARLKILSLALAEIDNGPPAPEAVEVGVEAVAPAVAPRRPERPAEPPAPPAGWNPAQALRALQAATSGQQQASGEVEPPAPAGEEPEAPPPPPPPEAGEAIVGESPALRLVGEVGEPEATSGRVEEQIAARSPQRRKGGAA